MHEILRAGQAFAGVAACAGGMRSKDWRHVLAACNQHTEGEKEGCSLLLSNALRLTAPPGLALPAGEAHAAGGGCGGPASPGLCQGGSRGSSVWEPQCPARGPAASMRHARPSANDWRPAPACACITLAVAPPQSSDPSLLRFLVDARGADLNNQQVWRAVKLRCSCFSRGDETPRPPRPQLLEICSAVGVAVPSDRQAVAIPCSCAANALLCGHALICWCTVHAHGSMLMAHTIRVHTSPAHACAAARRPDDHADCWPRDHGSRAHLEHVLPGAAPRGEL